MRGLAYRVVSKAVQTMSQSVEIKAVYRLLQGHYELDQGQLLSTLYTSHSTIFTETELVVDSLRGLLSRSEKYRAECANWLSHRLASEVKNIKPSSGPIWNAFVFQAADIMTDRYDPVLTGGNPSSLPEIIQRLRSGTDASTVDNDLDLFLNTIRGMSIT
jgi:hypothetical protein